MKKITSRSKLKDAILLLEVKQDIKEQRLKEEIFKTIEHFKPGNLLKNTLSDLASTPTLIDTVLSTAIGLGTGYLSKKIIIGTSGNLFRKFIGSVLQLGVTTVIAQHPNSVKSLGRFIIQHTVNKKTGILKPIDS